REAAFARSRFTPGAPPRHGFAHRRRLRGGEFFAPGEQKRASGRRWRMSEVQRTAPAKDAPAAQKVGRPGGRAGERKALELIATRGREVIGVRHLLEGKTARIGDVREALARVPMNELGGRSLVVGAVARGEH